MDYIKYYNRNNGTYLKCYPENLHVQLKVKPKGTNLYKNHRYILSYYVDVFFGEYTYVPAIYDGGPVNIIGSTNRFTLDIWV